MSPVNGQLWWESDSGDLFVWFNDGNTSQWVQISGPGLGDAPNDGNMYARQGGAWTQTNDAGEIASFAMKTPPAGWLKANGAAVNLSVYSRLVAIYCGNTDNATAGWGYRCTDPANPTTTRSTAGGYIVLPDGRGEFMRGFDDGRTVDPGRSMWAWQDGTKHPNIYADVGNFFLAPRNNAAANIDGYTGGSVGRSLVGGSENATTNTWYYARPRNFAPLVCIRY